MAEPHTVVVSTASGIPHGTELETPEGMPTLIVKAVTPLRRLITRVLRIYLTSLLGMLTIVLGNVAPDVLTPPHEFKAKFFTAAGFALAPATVQLLVNAVEWLTKQDT